MCVVVLSVHVSYIFCSQQINDLIKYRSSKQISVNKKGLHSIARCGVVTFGVSDWNETQVSIFIHKVWFTPTT